MTLIDKAEALLPCPFCGEIPTYGKQRIAACKTKGCAIEHRAIDLDIPEQVAAWNRRALPARGVGDTLQSRVWPWMLSCFGEEIARDKEERGDRLLEEVFELLQSGGYDPARVLALRDYVWSRDVGEPSQEVGGVMITLAAYCLAHDLDMHQAGETELARIWTKVEKIRAKQAAKPKGSALPQAWSAALAPTDAAQAREAHLREAAAAVRARYMGDNNREDQEVLRCEAAILAMIGDRP